MKTREGAHEPRRTGHQAGDTHLLQEIMRTSQALLHVFSREVGMPASQLALLRQLAIAPPGGTGVMDLARRLGVNAAAVTRLVQEMEREGFVTRRPDPCDGRRHDVVLTEAGAEAFQRLHRRGHELERTLLADVSSGDIATATRVLSHLRGAVERLALGERRDEQQR